MSPLSRDQIKQTIIEILKPFGVKRISLFGSFSRGESEPGSDIDILVKLHRGNRRKPIGLKWFGLPEEISRRIGMPVDLVTEESLAASLSPLIESDLEVIYDDEAG